MNDLEDRYKGLDSNDEDSNQAANAFMGIAFILFLVLFYLMTR